VVALASALVSAPASGAAKPKPPGSGSYVALGDSFTAGPLIPIQRDDPAGCLRSTNNYPSLVAPSLPTPEFRDASCSGAETEDMTSPQGVTPGPNPPQFDRLDRNTRVVTVGIGGNDIGFSEIVRNCFTLDPTGSPCQDRYVVGGQDEISQRIAATAPLVAGVIQGIHQRAPKAAVYVVGYPAVLPDVGNGCYPQMPVAYADVPYLRDKEKELNSMLAAQAATNGAVYVDTYTPSIGHDACQLPVIRWIEPVVPVSPAAPVHPNLQGMQGLAVVVRGAIVGG